MNPDDIRHKRVAGAGPEKHRSHVGIAALQQHRHMVCGQLVYRAACPAVLPLVQVCR